MHQVLLDCVIHLSHRVSDNVDLGTACGKYFRVSFLSIVDPGKKTKTYLPTFLLPKCVVGSSLILTNEFCLFDWF